MGIAEAKGQIVTRAVCDASILFKLIVVESDSAQAEAVVRSTQVIVPGFVFLEIANALWARVNRGLLDNGESRNLLERLLGMGFDVRSSIELAARALSFGNSIKHPIYDCLYLALAESERVPLITSDRRFLNALGKGALDTVNVRPLSSFA